MRAITTFHRRLFLLTRSLDKPIPNLRSHLPAEMRLLTEREVDHYRAFRPEQDRQQICGRLAKGHQCHASWHEGRIVDAAWCATHRGPIPYLGRELVLAPGDVFIYDAYTLPSRRGRNLFMAKFAHIFRTCHAAGFARNVGVVAVENRTSLAVLLRLGCEPIGMYSSVGLGPYRVIWNQPFGREPLPPLTAPSSN